MLKISRIKIVEIKVIKYFGININCLNFNDLYKNKEVATIQFEPLI